MPTVTGPVRTKTGPQIGGTVGDDGLLPRAFTRASYKAYREMRKNPTFALARLLSRAPAVSTSWSAEETLGAPPGAKQFIQDSFDPLRPELMRTAMNASNDFGWQAYEIAWAVDAKTRQAFPAELKQLLQDFTDVLVDKSTGAFMGVRQERDTKVDLNVDELLMLSFDMEGTDYYGYPQAESSRSSVVAWTNTEAAASRYDRKISGAHWVIYYPEGKSNYNGQEKQNHEIATVILNTLQASGTVAIPVQVERFVDTMNSGERGDSGWKIEIIGDEGDSASGFVERLGYHDAGIMRGMGFPERSVLEGKHGTKAEAESHGDLALLVLEQRRDLVVDQINKQVVNKTLVLNWGPEASGTVFLKGAPIADAALAYLRTLYNQLVQNPDVFLREVPFVDFPALRDRLGVPSLPETLEPGQASTGDLLPGTSPAQDNTQPQAEGA